MSPLMRIDRTADGLLVIEYGEIDRTLDTLVMFDLDLTLISNSANKFSSEWEYLFPEIPNRVRELSKQGSFIGIASNQSKLVELNVLDVFIEKVCSILSDLGVPIVFLAALARNRYRKPSIGMYEYVCKEYVDESRLYKKLYVGDAVDSSLGPGHTNSCDSKFAYNSRMEFKHPQEFFRGVCVVYLHRHFNVDEYRGVDLDIKDGSDIVFVFGRKKYCGKRFFAKKYFPEYKIIEEHEFTDDSKQCVLINCNSESLVSMAMNKHPGRCMIYYLDYPDEVMNYLKSLAILSGEDSREFAPLSLKIFETIERYGTKVSFVFDDSGFEEGKLKLSKMQL